MKPDPHREPEPTGAAPPPAEPRLDLLSRERDARRAAQEGERRWEFLARVGTLLDETHDYVAGFHALARLAVPRLCDYCLIDEVEEGGALRRIAIAHRDPERERFLYRTVRHADGDPTDAARHPVLHALHTGRSVLVPLVDETGRDDIAHDEEHRARLRALALHSYIVVPLTARGKALGAITLAAAESRRSFGPADLSLAEEVARRAALALDNARLYREARRALRAREHLLAVVSHELRNPLAGILLQATALLDDPASTAAAPAVREGLGWIVRSVEQSRRLIDDLLDFSSIEGGRLELRREPVEPSALLAEAERRHRAAAAAVDVALVVAGADALPRVSADPGRVAQVLANLVGNALKFTPPGGTVTLSATPDAEGVRVAVADTGPGIAAEDLPHVFEEYWQGGGADGRGAGLGLAIARAIVEGHGGTIRAEPAPGGGSAVSFTLPAA